MARSFFRIGQPVRIPVSATSASTPYDMTNKIPPNARTFLLINPNPFDVRLEGMVEGQTFTAVNQTSNTGWLIPARTVMGPFTTKRPVAISVGAFASPGLPLPDGFDYSTCVVELVYGDGE